MSFRFKTILGVALIEAVLLFLLIWSGLDYIESSNEREFTQRAQATVKSFAVTTKDPVLSSDLASLESFTDEVMTYPGVVYARVRDAEGQVLAEAGDGGKLSRSYAADSRIVDIDDGVFDTFAPIEEAGVMFGQVELGLSVTALQTVVSDARGYSTVIALVEMALVALFSFVLGSYLTRQLTNLTQGASRIADGNLGYQVPIQGRDELATAAQAFNRMSLEVERSYQQLAERELNLRTVLDNIQDGILLVEHDGTVGGMNPAAEAIFGCPADAVERLRLSDLVAAEFRNDLKGCLARPDSALWGKLRELEGRRRDGSGFPMEMTLTRGRQAERELIVAVVRNISQRKQVEEQLRLRERVIDASTLGVVIVDARLPDMPVVYVNPAFETITGYDAGEILGRNCRVLQGPDHDQAGLVTLRRAVEERRDCQVSLRNYRKDGSIFWNELSVTPILDEHDRLTHFVGLQNDVTERIEAERQLAASEAHLRGVLDATHDAIIVIDDHGIVLSFNRGAEAMFGLDAPDVIGRNVSLLVPSPHRENHDEYLREYRETGASRIVGKEREFEAERSDGSRFPIALRVNEMEESGRRRFIGVIHDITERKQKEQALKQAKELAEEAAAAKSQFLANMSHEIRTPMNGVLGALEMLRDTPLNRSQNRYLDTANSSAEVLLTVIDEILDFSRLEAGKLRIETLDFDLRKAVEDVTTMLGQRAFEKRLEVISFIDPAIPERLKGDPIRLRQVLINLVGNALKFTEHGEVVVNVNIVERRNGDLLLRFEVRDTGIGIPEAKQLSLFEPFLQADGSTSRRFGGTGLGLSISRRLVELMHGEIGLRSTPGQGSTFWFQMPFKQAEKRSQDRVTDFAGRRILVVDDNTTNRIIMHRYLSGWGSSPGSAADGEEALAKMGDSAGSGQPYDLAILDYHMPDMNGGELSRLIREDAQLKDTRLIMVSSEGYSEKLEAELDVDIWLTKPLRQSDLHDAIATVFGDLNRRASEDDPIPAKGVNFSGESVLLVEDNLVSQALAREMLRRRGLEVQSANNGLQALEMACEGGFDIILMDVQMPEMDGYEATRRILQWEQGNDRLHTPIIALTAHALPQDRQQCLDAGMDDYLVKPYNLESLANIIFRWLSPPGGKTRKTPEPEVFDSDKLREIERMMGEQYPILLDQFHQGLQQDLKQAREQIASADRAGLRETVHKLKNNAGNLGVNVLFQMTLEMEKSLDGQQLDQALAQRMLGELERVLTATGNLLEEVRA